jgi:hypothetical protein
LQRLDQIVLDIGYRLARSGGDLCSPGTPLPGFTVHDISTYFKDERPAAREIFGFQDAPLVLSVARDSAAASAGLRPGDALLTIDGAPATSGSAAGDASFARVAALLEQIDHAAADDRLDLGLRRDGRPLDLHIALEKGCATRFAVTADKAIDSRSDGRYALINAGMLGFAQKEELIAAIIAHELAHNILRHRARLEAAGRTIRAIRATEAEADRLSVYLMDRAAYDPGAAVAFWIRHARSHPLMLRSPTHLRTKERIALIRAEIVRLAAMKATGQSPRPLFMEAESLPSLD